MSSRGIATTNVAGNIFNAIHKGKWLYIEYRNMEDKNTKYWIGIKDLNAAKGILTVDGLHLVNHSLMKNAKIYIEKIKRAQIIDGSYQEINERLVADIKNYPSRYEGLFGNSANLKILYYLVECNKLDSTPYQSKFELIEKLDVDRLQGSEYDLSDEQFKTLVDTFQKKANIIASHGKIRTDELCVNLLSVNTKKGLYVLAYKKLLFDVEGRRLIADDEIDICRELTIDGTVQSVKQFLDADDYALLDDFEKNSEKIKDAITQNVQAARVDDLPYIIGMSRNQIIDLEHEYSGIWKMYEEENVSTPIKAFFGDLLERPRRNKTYPFALIDRKVNIDQLLAVNNGTKYPVAYVQGPPGTGKTNTIINTIITAFFNERTVLFSSYNNHPIEGVFEALTTMSYRGADTPFPILMIGNTEKMSEAIDYIKLTYEKAVKMSVFESALDKNENEQKEQARRLSELLKRYEERLDLLERRETIRKLLETTPERLLFQIELQQRQLTEVEARLGEIGEIKDEDALSMLNSDTRELKKWLHYTSAKYIKRLKEPKYSDLWSIVNMEDRDKAVYELKNYLSDEENIKKLLRVFPVLVTTCISARRLGEPKPKFDMVIIDEASQCNMAISLVPVVRGDNLMLVGDPQQLNPVIVLDAAANEYLRKKYGVPDEYDYVTSSVYKTYLACDSVSDEVLLSYHYRCKEEIIGFSNKKYYNGKLQIKSGRGEDALVFCDLKNSTTDVKNTAPLEAEKVVEYCRLNRDKSIGVITPFANQKKLIESMLKESKLNDVPCGTVHAFQGDEKETILFSLGVTDKTTAKTYGWLKNNKELINVATSRAKDKLMLVGSMDDITRLHELGGQGEDDDLFELAHYVMSNGRTTVTTKSVNSRALGIKPYSTETEEAFLTTLNHALGNIFMTGKKYTVKKEVPISHVFEEEKKYRDLFYTGRFDFVVYEVEQNRKEYPVLAIELDGREHEEDEAVRRRDGEKQAICRGHRFELIRVGNSYARRYNYIKDILTAYFANLRSR